MAKKKKPKKDFAQNALANLLKATGAKSLVPDNVERGEFVVNKQNRKPD